MASASPLFMAEQTAESKSVLFPISHSDDSTYQQRGGYLLDVFWPAAEPINPRHEAIDNVRLYKDGQEYHAAVITPSYLNWLFEKNKTTGECASGTYFAMRGMMLLPSVDIDTIGRVMDKLLDNFGLERLVAWRHLQLAEDPPESTMSYKEFVKAYKKRFDGYRAEILPEEGFDQKKGRAKVKLTTDGQEHVSNFVSRSYFLQAQQQHQDQETKVIDQAGVEYHSGLAISIPYLVVVDEITDDAVRKSIDDLVEFLSIQDHFRLITA